MPRDVTALLSICLVISACEKRPQTSIKPEPTPSEKVEVEEGEVGAALDAPTETDQRRWLDLKASGGGSERVLVRGDREVCVDPDFSNIIFRSRIAAVVDPDPEGTREGCFPWDLDAMTLRTRGGDELEWVRPKEVRFASIDHWRDWKGYCSKAERDEICAHRATYLILEAKLECEHFKPIATYRRASARAHHVLATKTITVFNPLFEKTAPCEDGAAPAWVKIDVEAAKDSPGRPDSPSEALVESDIEEIEVSYEEPVDPWERE